MSLLEIIRKESRTREEQEKAFDILFKADGTVTKTLPRSTVRDMNAFLDSLSLVSKSRMLQREFCPFNFKCGYIVRMEKELPDIARVGKNLHLADDYFWETARTPLENNMIASSSKFWKQKDSLKDALLHIRHDDDIEKVLRRKYVDIIPDYERDEQVMFFANEFVKFETYRITEIIHELGLSQSVIERYIMPVATELPIENYGNNTMGIIDRIDRTTNDALVVIEYKYGKPKYHRVNWQRSVIMGELCFYRVLLEGKDVNVITSDENFALPIEEVFPEKPLPYYGAMLFFQDIENTKYLLKLNREAIAGTRKRINNYWASLNTGNFAPKPKLFGAQICPEYCQYYDGICEFNPVWEAVDNGTYDEDREKVS